MCSKLLGVDIDSKLNFSKHISKVSSKLAYCGYMLSKLQGTVSTDVLKLIYNAFGNSFLTYSVSVWGNTFSSTLKPLKVIQNSLIRRLHVNYDNIRTDELYKHLNILTVNNLYLLYSACYIFKAQHNLVPNSISNLLIIQNTHYYNTRHMNLLNKPQYKLMCSTKDLSWSGPTIWNKLPLYIKDSTSFSLFKLKLKNFLLM